MLNDIKYMTNNNKEIKLGIFIPGRLSSERLPNKLLLPLDDKTTTLWEVACIKLNNLNQDIVKVALCSDQELINVAKLYPGLDVVERDPETSKAEGPMSYIFKDLKDSHPEVTHWMFLNPCLPFLREETISRSLNIFKKNPFEFATSVKEYKNWLFNKDGNPLTYIDYNTLSTKEIYGTFEAAHAFHIFSKEFLFIENKKSLMIGRKPGLLVIPNNELIDVDTQEDYNYLTYLYKK